MTSSSNTSPHYAAMPLWQAYFREPTKGQWASFSAAWFGWVLDAFDFTIFLLVMPQISKEFGVTMTNVTFSITLTLLLRLLGGFAAGWAADKWGRKLPLMLSVLWFAACDGGIAFAPTFKAVIILRTLFGLGMGAEWAAGTTMAMENWPKRTRGIASGVLQGSWAIGYLLASKVSGWMLNADGTNWRTLFLVAAAPALLVLPIRLWVPESLDAAKSEDADKGTAGQSTVTATPVADPVASKGLAWTLVLASAYTGLAFAAYYAFTTLYASFLNLELHLLPPSRAHLVVLFNVGMMVGSLGCGYLAAKWSPIGAILMCSCTIFFVLPLYVGWASGYVGLDPYTLLEIGAFLGGIFGAGFCGVTPLLLTSMFPAGVRARSIGIVYHVGACFAAFAPPLVTILVEHFHFSYAQAIAFSTGGFHFLLGIALVFRPRGLFEGSEAKNVKGEPAGLPVPEFH